MLTLALGPDQVERGVGAAHEVEVVDHDPRLGEHRPDRLAVGLAGGSIETTSIASLRRPGTERR